MALCTQPAEHHSIPKDTNTTKETEHCI